MKLKYFWIGPSEKELRYSVDGGATWSAVPTEPQIKVQPVTSKARRARKAAKEKR